MSRLEKITQYGTFTSSKLSIYYQAKRIQLGFSTQPIAEMNDLSNNAISELHCKNLIGSEIRYERFQKSANRRNAQNSRVTNELKTKGKIKTNSPKTKLHIQPQGILPTEQMDSTESKPMEIKVEFHDLDQEEQLTKDEGEEDMDNLEPLRLNAHRKSNESLPTLLQRAQSSDSPFSIGAAHSGAKEKPSLNKLASYRLPSRRPSEISVNDFLSMPPVLESIDAQRRSTLGAIIDDKQSPSSRRTSITSEENVHKVKHSASEDCNAVRKCYDGEHTNQDPSKDQV
ncbi:unnamed protein product [Trichobilharzia szidati]|nr:unnamed protein product [Trichobilharzia szidati]